MTTPARNKKLMTVSDLCNFSRFNIVNIKSLLSVAKFKRVFAAVAPVSFVILTGCASNSLPTSGPSSKDVENAAAVPDTSIIELVEINSAVTRRLSDSEKKQTFSDGFKATRDTSYVVNPGDVLEISVWEASPALLFGTAPSFAGLSAGGSGGSKNTSLPEQMISKDGLITVPFAGRIKVAGKSLAKIESEIVEALKGKANYPQVIARLTRNSTTNVTVVGEVNKSIVLPLTPRGERLLDAIAEAGGVKQPVEKITVQISRNSVVKTMALEKIIQDPRQNILLNPGDVITTFYQPYSFTALGATGKNDEINFVAQGISLTQAIARAGGMQDQRSDVKGVFVFRFEEPDALKLTQAPKSTDSEGKIPVVYRLDLSDPSAFFVGQNFKVKDKDVIYVANASSVELSKFLNILVSFIYPIVNAGSIARGF
jgi:polysaccharide export outer membrane protein